jgi:hypothetical protein
MTLYSNLHAAVVAAAGTTGAYTKKVFAKLDLWASSVSTQQDVQDARLSVLESQVAALISPPPPPPPLATGWSGMPAAPAGLVASTPTFLYPGATGAVVAGKQIVGTGTKPEIGLGIMNWPPVASTPCTVSDVSVDNIGASPLGSNSAGTDGAGLWFGQPGTYQRLKVTNARWEGLWVGALCRNTVISDLSIDNSMIVDPLYPGIGIYVEHAAQDVEIKYAVVKPKAGGTAINFEWRYADATYGPLDELKDGKAGDCRVWVHDCRLYGHVVVDAGSYGHRFERISFIGGDGVKAAITLPNHIPVGTTQSVVNEASCDFSGWNGPHVAYHNNAIG